MVHLDGQDGPGVQDALHLVAHNVHHHHRTDALEAAARGAGAATEEHARREDDPRDVVPLGDVGIEDARGGHEGDDLKEALPDGFRPRIAVDGDEDGADDGGRHEYDADVELELGVVEELPEASLEQGGIEEGEAGSGEEHEEDGDVVDVGAVEEPCVIIVRSEPSRCGGGHGVVHAVEEAHTRLVVAEGAGKGQDEVYAPDPFGGGAQAGVHLRPHGACGLRSEHFHATAHERGDDGNGEEGDSKTANPLRHGAPEEQGVRQALHVVENGAACGSESRHGLEEGIGEVGDVAADDVGKGTEQAEDDPGECDQQVCLALAERVVGVPAEVLEAGAAEHGDNDGHDKGEGILFSEIDRHAHAERHHRRL